MWERRRGRGNATQENGRRDRGRQVVNLGGGPKGDGVEDTGGRKGGHMRMPTNLDDSWIVQLVLRPLGFHLIAFFQIFKQGQPGGFFPLGPPASTGFVSRLSGGSGLGESFAFLECLSHLEGGREGRREGGKERENMGKRGERVYSFHWPLEWLPK